jgi:lipoprotein-releasing system permease protein
VNLTWFLARRYLSSTRGGGRLLSFITWIALGGVVVGVTALIVVIGVMTGMQEDLREKILSSNPHVLVLQQGSSLTLDHWQQVVDTILTTEGVTAVTPFVLGQTVIQVRGYSKAANLYGVPTDPVGGTTTEMEERIRSGILDLAPPESGLPPLLMGSGLANVMNVFTGDTVVLATVENLELDLFGQIVPTLRPFEVTGTFTTGMYDYDTKNAYTTLEAAQDFLNLSEEDQVSGIGVRTSDAERATEIGGAIQAKLGFPYYVESWMTTNRALFSALKLEKLAMGLILLLIVVVAAFNIVSTLIMVVADRTREIGILKSMGMTDQGILRVFMVQGAWIGVVGTLIGTASGLVLCWVLDTFEIIQIPPEVYFVDRLPVQIDALDIAAIVAASIVIAFAATIYPSIQASRLEPVEAIRHE